MYALIIHTITIIPIIVIVIPTVVMSRSAAIEITCEKILNF